MNVRDLEFSKLSAAGNDFILFDNRSSNFAGDESDIFHRICKRRIAVGADGILLLEKSDDHDFSMRYYNADGSLGEMCGNGARAAAYYAYMNGIASGSMKFDVLGVVYKARVMDEGIELGMPPPVKFEMKPGVNDMVNLQEGAYLDVGVPHYVLFAEDIDRLNVIDIGRFYRYHDSFQPKGVNVNFVQIIDEHNLRIRTYERGVEDETLACGTGTISSAMTAFTQHGIRPPVHVETRGGHLIVSFKSDFQDLTLTGPAKIVYKGKIIDI